MANEHGNGLRAAIDKVLLKHFECSGAIELCGDHQQIALPGGPNFFEALNLVGVLEVGPPQLKNDGVKLLPVDDRQRGLAVHAALTLKFMHEGQEISNIRSTTQDQNFPSLYYCRHERPLPGTNGFRAQRLASVPHRTQAEPRSCQIREVPTAKPSGPPRTSNGPSRDAFMVRQRRKQDNVTLVPLRISKKYHLPQDRPGAWVRERTSGPGAGKFPLPAANPYTTFRDVCLDMLKILCSNGIRR